MPKAKEVVEKEKQAAATACNSGAQEAPISTRENYTTSPASCQIPTLDQLADRIAKIAARRARRLLNKIAEARKQAEEARSGRMTEAETKALSEIKQAIAEAQKKAEALAAEAIAGMTEKTAEKYLEQIQAALEAEMAALEARRAEAEKALAEALDREDKALAKAQKAISTAETQLHELMAVSAAARAMVKEAEEADKAIQVARDFGLAMAAAAEEPRYDYLTRLESVVKHLNRYHWYVPARETRTWLLGQEWVRDTIRARLETANMKQIKWAEAWAERLGLADELKADIEAARARAKKAWKQAWRDAKDFAFSLPLSSEVKTGDVIAYHPYQVAVYRPENGKNGKNGKYTIVAVWKPVTSGGWEKFVPNNRTVVRDLPKYHFVVN